MFIHIEPFQSLSCVLHFQTDSINIHFQQNRAVDLQGKKMSLLIQTNTNPLFQVPDHEAYFGLYSQNARNRANIAALNWTIRDYEHPQGPVAGAKKSPKNLCSPLHIDCSIEYDLRSHGQLPENSGRLLIIHPAYQTQFQKQQESVNCLNYLPEPRSNPNALTQQWDHSEILHVSSRDLHLSVPDKNPKPLGIPNTSNNRFQHQPLQDSCLEMIPQSFAKPSFPTSQNCDSEIGTPCSYSLSKKSSSLSKWTTRQSKKAWKAFVSSLRCLHSDHFE